GRTGREAAHVPLRLLDRRRRPPPGLALGGALLRQHRFPGELRREPGAREPETLEEGRAGPRSDRDARRPGGGPRPGARRRAVQPRIAAQAGDLLVGQLAGPARLRDPRGSPPKGGSRRGAPALPLRFFSEQGPGGHPDPDRHGPARRERLRPGPGPVLARSEGREEGRRGDPDAIRDDPETEVKKKAVFAL